MKRIIINDRYTYECQEDVRVGDTCVLPSPRVGKDGKPTTWRGTVTALESTYTGPCKQVLEVIHEAELLPDGTISPP